MCIQSGSKDTIYQTQLLKYWDKIGRPEHLTLPNVFSDLKVTQVAPN